MDPDGTPIRWQHPICFISRTTTSSEKRYSPHLLELVATKWALEPKPWKGRCLRKRLPLAHDQWHEAIWALTSADLSTDLAVENVVTDCLSRNALLLHWEPYSSRLNGVCGVSSGSPRKTPESSRCETPPDGRHIGSRSGHAPIRPRPLLRTVVRFLLLLGNEVPPDSASAGRTRALARCFFVKGSTLFRMWDKDPHCECIPAAEVEELTSKIHTQLGHTGRDSLLVKLRASYFWPNITASTIHAIEACNRCSQFRPRLQMALSPVIYSNQ